MTQSPQQDKIWLTQSAHDKLVAELENLKGPVRQEVIECHEVDGRFDYLLKTRVADMLAYKDFVSSVVWTLPGVREVRTYAVIDEIKNTARIPVPA